MTGTNPATPAVKEAAVAPGPPPAPVRGEALLARLDAVCAWLDGFVARFLPAACNPLAQAGAAANAALIVAIVSGVALLLWYSPSLTGAYESLAALRGRSLGGWVRALHRYSSDLALLLILVHAGRVFVARKFSGARWLPWVSGVGLIALVWFIGWTGYWLVWDQPAQQVAVASMRLLDTVPIFGEPLGRLFVADRLVPSLLFFVVFFLHMLLPLAIAIGLALHLVRVSRARLLPRWPLGVALAAGLGLSALAVPAPLDEPARMALNAEAFTVDAWYLTPLALALRFQHAGLWLALGGTTLVAAALPWLLGRRRPPASYQAAVNVSRCHACTQCVQDCPFDAVTMVPRTDGRRWPSQAEVDPARCVGCGVCAGSCDSEGIVLPWFDTQREESRLSAEIAAARAAGNPPWVAFVAGDIDGPLGLARAARWRDWLPGYQVHVVPTASWVRPKFVEHLLHTGVRGVLVVRDARAEAAARDGNRWVSDRLEGERKPVFRPDRAGGSRSWRVVDHDPARPGELRRIAAAFRGEETAVSKPRVPGPFAAAAAGALLAALLAVATIAPSRLRVTNPAPARPELVFSFKALGELGVAGTVDPVAEAAKPVHMRGRPSEKPQRAPVRVRLTIDGVTHERTYRAKGVSQDGPALDEWREPLTEGARAVTIEIVPGPATPPLRWSGAVQATARHRHVITYAPDAGFRVE